MSIVWRKAWRDLALEGNRTRTLLAVLSIAAGAFALGLALGARDVVHLRLEEDKHTTRPAHVFFRSNIPGRDAFDTDTVEAVLRDPGVADAEGAAYIPFRWKLEGEADWRQGVLVARANYTALEVSRLELLSGQWPTERTLAVERLSAQYFDVPLGAMILIGSGQSEQRLPVEGIIRKPYVLSPQFGGLAAFYVTPETATWLTGSEGFNWLYVRLAPLDEGGMDQVRERVRERLERMGFSVAGGTATGVEYEFDAHEIGDWIDAMFLILGILGALSLGLSAFLIVNTMNAILVQQVWQIGVMKVIGATFGRVVRMYLVIASAYGGLAVLLAVPLGIVGAQAMADWLLGTFNITATGGLRVSPVAVIVQIAVALVTPLLTALVPVIGGARVTPRQAISSYGLGGQFGRGPLDRLVGRVRRLPRPLTLSLRNTFRRKARVALTLFTFTLVGVMFIMVTSARLSFDSSVETMLQGLAYDVMVVFSRPYRTVHLVETTGGIPGVTRVEVWDQRNARLSWASEELEIGVYSIPPDSEVLHPRIVSGRRLLPNDGRAIMLNHSIAAGHGIRVGDEVALTIAGKETTWTVVGLVSNVSPGRDNFVSFDVLAQETGTVGRGGIVMVMSESHNVESQESLVDGLGDVYTARHIEVNSFMSANEFRGRAKELFDIISYLLLTMALLAALVGSIGLMGTLSINLVERRREIGVMRAIGASSFAIVGVFIGESVFLGLLSWLLAVLLSYPGARLFSDAIGRALFGMALDFSYSLTGVIIWLAIVLTLSALAGLWPALQATKVSVRESLAYE